MDLLMVTWKMDDRKKFEKIDLIVRVSFVVISLEVD